ncbi:MAG TPA: hypothetical protein VFW03_12235 [Gemmatimonadaceae bacterium]|nr:hypothetical protein [Gemmatimonadaceae bacterium]
MHRFAPAVFAIALAQAVLVPLPLTAQRRAALTVGVTTVDQNHESRQPVESGGQLSPHPWPGADSTAKKLSLGRHLLVGAGIGTVAGLVIATYGQSRQTGPGDEDMMPFLVPAFGAAGGALLGTVIGWTVYLVRISPPPT